MKINDLKINYPIGGKGKPLLLMHGWLGTSYTSRKIAPKFVKEGNLVIIPDMKGMGIQKNPKKVMII